jgi:hypothetical protein
MIKSIIDNGDKNAIPDTHNDTEDSLVADERNSLM